MSDQPRHIIVREHDIPRGEIDVLTDWISRLDQRVDSLTSEIDRVVREAVAAHSVRQLSDEQLRWVELAIQREAQSIRLRQAIIEKTLTGLVWAAVLGAGSIIYQWLQAHGWRP